MSAPNEESKSAAATVFAPTPPPFFPPFFSVVGSTPRSLLHTNKGPSPHQEVTMLGMLDLFLGGGYFHGYFGELFLANPSLYLHKTTTNWHVFWCTKLSTLEAVGQPTGPFCLVCYPNWDHVHQYGSLRISSRRVCWCQFIVCTSISMSMYT